DWSSDVCSSDLGRLARRHSAHLLLVYVPIKFRVYRGMIELPPGSEMRGWTLWPLPDLFAQLCRAEGLACLDLTEPLRGAIRDGAMPYPPADLHWSPEGHQLVASRLEQALVSLGWVSTRHVPGAS